MLSRVADHIYWLARYLERADYTARVLDVNSQMVLDMSGYLEADAAEAWLPIIEVSGGRESFLRIYKDVNESNSTQFMLFDSDNPDSIRQSIASARENARAVRDQISSEMWEQINRFHLRLKGDTYESFLRIGPSEYLNRVKSSIHLFYGIADSMMPRSQGWEFFNLGRFLERANNLSRLIDVKCISLLPAGKPEGSAVDLIQWAALLRSCWAFEAFRKNRQGRITGKRVLDYLILDEFFPKSIRFSVTEAESALRQISDSHDHHFKDPAGRALGRLRAELDYAEINDLIETDIHAFLLRLQSDIANISSLIDHTFISYPVEEARMA